MFNSNNSSQNVKIVTESKFSHIQVDGKQCKDVDTICSVWQSDEYTYSGILCINLEKTLTLDGLKKLAENLKFAPAGMHLNISRNQLGDEGVAVIAGHLLEAKPGIDISFQKMGITDVGAKVLADVVADEKCQISKINLRLNSITTIAADNSQATGVDIISEGCKNNRLTEILGFEDVTGHKINEIRERNRNAKSEASKQNSETKVQAPLIDSRAQNSADTQASSTISTFNPN